MRALKVALAVTAVYTVATGYGVYRALMWKPWL